MRNATAMSLIVGIGSLQIYGMYCAYQAGARYNTTQIKEMGYIRCGEDGALYMGNIDFQNAAIFSTEQFLYGFRDAVCGKKA